MYDVAVETPPAFPPVSAIELRAFLRLNDTSEDALLGEFVAAAAAQFEHETGRPVVATAYRQTFTRWPATIVLGKGGVTAVASVRRFLADGSEEAVAGWAADLATPPARVRLATPPVVPTLAGGLAVCPVGVVRFTAGWAIAAVPPTVRHAVKLLAAHFYSKREAYLDSAFEMREMPAGWRAVCRMYKFGLDGDWGAVMGAGDYPDRLEHRARVRPGPNGFGEKIPDAFPLTARLWGVVEDIAASREERLGSERQETRVVIRLRNYPAVRPQDRLAWPEWDETYVVESARRGDNELIVEARRWSP